MGNIYIEVGKDNIVTKAHHHPFDPKYGLNQTREELELTGYFVSEIPEPQMIVGKRAIMRYNSDTKRIYYTYDNIPLSDKERLNNIESMLNELIMQGLLKEE